MDRLQLLLLGLPLFLFCSDILNLFTPPPPPPPSSSKPHHHHSTNPPAIPTQIQNTNNGGGEGGGSGLRATININFCSSCSYRGTAETMKKMLETSFPGTNVILANHPPPLPKRLLRKVVPVFQIAITGIVMAGEYIFPRLGYMTPPPWYFSMRQNRFGTIATTVLLGNVLQSSLQGSGAFEVYCNNELVFSKLKERRVPGEIELRDLLSRKLGDSTVIDGIRTDGLWS